MTPTTAEQMPQPNWELVLQCVQIKANACISPELASLYTEQHAALNSWLAQGGARGGDGMVLVPEDPTDAMIQAARAAVKEQFYTEVPTRAGEVIYAAMIDAALAPRAEAGEAVLGVNGGVGQPTYPTIEGVEHDPDFQGPTALFAAMYQAAGAYDFPERWMDALSAAANGDPYTCDGLLPIMPPTAACGVSGLASDEMARAAHAAYFDDNGPTEVELACMKSAVNAALKANRGGVSEALIRRAYEVVHHDEDCQAIGGNGDGDCTCDAVPFLRDLTAALNAGALAGGGVVAWQYRVRFGGEWQPWRDIPEATWGNGRKTAHENIQYRSLVVGGVGA